jgi:hypothetical protein
VRRNQQLSAISPCLGNFHPHFEDIQASVRSEEEQLSRHEQIKSNYLDMSRSKARTTSSCLRYPFSLLPATMNHPSTRKQWLYIRKEIRVPIDKRRLVPNLRNQASKWPRIGFLHVCYCSVLLLLFQLLLFLSMVMSMARV